MVRFYSAREFNQDTAGAKRAAEDGPVYVTDRGRPSHVLLSMAAYDRLLRGRGPGDPHDGPPGPRDIVALLGSDPRVADIELPIERSRIPEPEIDLDQFLD
jgi:prevent-host-death family protein